MNELRVLTIKLRKLEDYEVQFLEIMARGIKRMHDRKAAEEAANERASLCKKEATELINKTYE
jgi:hypothetical protein